MDLRNKACPHLIIQEHVIIGAKIITLNKRFICSSDSMQAAEIRNDDTESNYDVKSRNDDI